ncbi:MAG: heme-binding beta-barrel domain-containing protein [Candidatus Dormibacteria bacterium]
MSERVGTLSFTLSGYPGNRALDRLGSRRRAVGTQSWLTAATTAPKVCGVSAPTASLLLDPFRFLLGSWSGKGVGVWRPDSPFRYREELLLEVVPDRDLIHLQQRTFDAETDSLRHSEQGYLRLFPAGEAELVVAVPAGYTEIYQGRVEGTILRLELVTLAVSPRPRPLDRTQRRLIVSG